MIALRALVLLAIGAIRALSHRPVAHPPLPEEGIR